MNIVILCTDPNHPVNTPLKEWQLLTESNGHEVRLESTVDKLGYGDILFLVSCSAIIDDEVKKKFKAVLVLHASDLPEGRGWSPHIWSILADQNKIAVCLLEASDPVDSGDIWLKKYFKLEGHELLDEINEALFAVELELMTEAVDSFNTLSPIKQVTAHRQLNSCTLRKRTSEDSALDLNKSILDQFNLLRVVDSERYPAYIDHLGHRYKITIEKTND